ncbi:heme/copper-type cytochrome/quinol oxidase subunit 4 [Kaistia defluvii]|uniref:Heme/copper-type cytochrome/quinol oxidase subunit 4 n=2 Tax=Kaistiaceae TaxID=2831111 RepID=A0ABV2QUW6_9HYPH
MHPVAAEYLPFFITAPGQSDVLFNGMAIFMLAIILVVGNLYFQLHAIPERMAHRTNVVQMQVVAVLALISLFTHNHLFWIAGLLLALVRIPDFSTPMASIAGSLEKLAGQQAERTEQLTLAAATTGGNPPVTAAPSSDRLAVEVAPLAMPEAAQQRQTAGEPSHV